VIFALLHFSNTGVFEKWRHIPVPHRRMLKNLFFSILLEVQRKGGKSVGMAIYQNEKERMQHLGAIHEIARMSGRPEDEVQKVYELELSKLMQAARLKDFLPVLARRVVLENLRHSPQAKSEV
jgi:hypothetical protein